MNMSLYPRPDPIADERYHRRLNIIKKNIKSFELSHKIFGKLEQYDDATYLDNKNSILYSLINGFNTYKITLLEDSLRLCRKKFNIKKYKTFCARISNLDHDKSKSAFDEIVTMYKLANKIGIENIKYEPKVRKDKNCDIGLVYNNTEIYLELTFIRSVNRANAKINNIFHKVAKYIYDKIDVRPNLHIMLELDTRKLCFDKNSHIDVDQSIRKLCKDVDKLPISDLFELNYHMPVDKLVKQKDTPFVAAYSTKGEYFSIRIKRESNLRNSELNEIDKKSFLNQIKNKLEEKISTKQYKYGHPFIIMINIHESSYDIDPNYCNHDALKKTISDTLLNRNFISGVLVYTDEYEDGIYFVNNNANDNIKLNVQTIKNLFFNN